MVPPEGVIVTRGGEKKRVVAEREEERREVVNVAEPWGAREGGRMRKGRGGGPDTRQSHRASSVANV